MLGSPWKERCTINDRLIHEVAWVQAHALMDLVGHNYREEEQRELFAAFYQASRAALESFRIQFDRHQQRVSPSKN